MENTSVPYANGNLASGNPAAPAASRTPAYSATAQAASTAPAASAAFAPPRADRTLIAIEAIAALCAFGGSQYGRRLWLLLVQIAACAALLLITARTKQALAWRICDIGLFLVAMSVVPFGGLGGQLLLYATAAAVAGLDSARLGWSLFVCGFGFCVVLSSFGWFARPLDVLPMGFAGAALMLYGRSRGIIQQQADQLAADLRTIESLTITREHVRMAEDMHDSIGQQLASIHFHALAAAQALADNAPSDVASRLIDIDQLTVAAQQQVRRLARASSPAGAEGIISDASVARFVDSFQSAGLVGELRLVGSLDALSLADKALLYRGLQELASNAVRHARATRLLFEIRVEPRRWALAVHDDGVGLDEADINHGFGLRTLRERTRACDGELSVTDFTQLGGGMVTLAVPRRFESGGESNDGKDATDGRR